MTMTLEQLASGLQVKLLYADGSAERETILGTLQIAYAQGYKECYEAMKLKRTALQRAADKTQAEALKPSTRRRENP